MNSWINMTAHTILDGRFSNYAPRMRVATTPFSRNLSPRRNIPSRIMTTQKPLTRPERAILLGDLLHPETGESVGPSYLPLPSVRGANEAINVFGPSGSGKSIVIRSLIEYFSIVEGRCVIIIDPTKNQYWSLKYPQTRADMVSKLRAAGLEPVSIPEVEVFVPVYDVPVLGVRSMERDFHSRKENFISIRTSDLTSQGFFDLGDIDAGGKMYQLYLENALNVEKSKRTIDYIRYVLSSLMDDPNKKRSIASLKNMFDPLAEQGIISDNGTDVKKRMMHAPRRDRPGRISVINLGTSSANDRRKNALVASICNQIFDVIRDDLEMSPVIVLDEAKEFIAARKGESSEATITGFSRLHLQGRAWNRTVVYGFQNIQDVQGWATGANTPITIAMTKSLVLKDGVTRLNGTGLGHIWINGSGDPKIPDMDFLTRFYPCRTKHID